VAFDLLAAQPYDRFLTCPATNVQNLEQVRNLSCVVWPCYYRRRTRAEL